MLFRNIQNLATVAFKHFFDLDIHVFSNLFLIVLVFGGLIKLFCSKLFTELHTGLVTVKEDAINIVHDVKSIKSQWTADKNESIAH